MPARISEVRLDGDREAVLAVDEGDARRLRDLHGKLSGIDEEAQVTAHPDADPERGDREVRPDGAALRRPGVELQHAHAGGERQAELEVVAHVPAVDADGVRVRRAAGRAPRVDRDPRAVLDAGADSDGAGEVVAQPEDELIARIVDGYARAR